MKEFHCIRCGYFLFATDAEIGTVRAICRKCRKNQVVDVTKAPAPARKARLLTLMAA